MGLIVARVFARQMLSTYTPGDDQSLNAGSIHPVWWWAISVDPVVYVVARVERSIFGQLASHGSACTTGCLGAGIR